MTVGIVFRRSSVRKLQALTSQRHPSCTPVRCQAANRWHRPSPPACCTLALWLSGCAALPNGPSGAPPASFLASNSPESVGVLIAGRHTGLVLPADELGMLRDRLQLTSNAHFVSIGWGNRRFYMANPPDSGDALAAVFPSESVLLIQAIVRTADATPSAGELEWLCLDRNELWRLDSYLSDSLQWRGGRPLQLGPGPLPQSRFYASGVRYDAFNNCNTWTIGALQFAGVPVTSSGVLFAGQVARRIGTLPACLDRGVPTSSQRGTEPEHRHSTHDS